MFAGPNQNEVIVDTKKGSGSVLTVLFLGVLMGALDIAILGPAIPAIRETFELDDRLASWVFSVWVLANLVSVPVMTKLADKYGRKKIYLFDLALFGIGSLIVSLSPTYGVLLAGRALQGMAASGIFPVAAAVIGDVVAPEKRGRAFGMLGSVFGLAFIIGPIFAGFMLKIGWRWLYMAIPPGALIILILGWKFLPVSPVRSEKKLDLRGLVFLAGFLLSLAYALSILDTTDLVGSLSSWRVASAFLAASVLLPLFVWAERNVEDPVLRLDLFRNRQVALASVIAVGAGINEAAFIFFPTITVLAFGVTTSTASFMLLPMMVAVAIGSPVAGRLLDKFGSKTIVLSSNFLLAMGMFGVATTTTAKPVFYIGSVLIGLGLAGLLGSSLNYILIHEARKRERAISQGLITLFISVGQLFSAAVVGAIAASSDFALDGYKTAFLVIVTATLLISVASFFLKNKAEEQETVFGGGDSKSSEDAAS